MEKGKNFVVGVYDEEDVLLEAVGKIRHQGVKINEVYTPYPVHGLDDALGYHYSNLPIAGFLFGLTGTILALTMMIYTLGFDWPMDIGGKPYIALPDFIPITFELTVLLCALGMTGTFFVASNLKPWAQPKMFDPRSVDDKFVLTVDLAKNASMDAIALSGIIKASGASEVSTKTME
ncbi:MAG: DUF3341 domain-containing protein [Cytophagaceae bacterium]|jgi:hypothetical protein|nr:DUF3341 domain-containing protein [Cytophagaceae bacterium]